MGGKLGGRLGAGFFSQVVLYRYRHDYVHEDVDDHRSFVVLVCSCSEPFMALARVSKRSFSLLRMCES